MKLFFDEIDAEIADKYSRVPVFVVISAITIIVGYTQNFFGLGADFVLLIVAGIAAAGVIFCIQTLARIESRLAKLQRRDD